MLIVLYRAIGLLLAISENWKQDRGRLFYNLVRPRRTESLGDRMNSPVLSNVQFAFAAFFAAMFAAMIRRSDIWYPFTPTRTHEPGEWSGLGDFVRWGSAFVMLLCVPATYFIYVLQFLQDYANSFALSPFPPTVWDFFKVVVLVLMVLPPLACYNIWQVLVRVFGKYLYSERAMAEIQKHYPVAFKGSYANAVAYALVYVMLPLAGAVIVVYYSRGGA